MATGHVTKEQIHEGLHQFRKEVDTLIKQSAWLKKTYGDVYGREMSLVHTKLQEAKMWAGKCLEAADSPFPDELRDESEEVKNNA